jgi:hypothetical protein
MFEAVGDILMKSRVMLRHIKYYTATDVSIKIHTSIFRNTQWRYYAPTEGL